MAPFTSSPTFSAIPPPPPPPTDLLSLPPSLRILSLNCWGLKYISTHRHARLVEIGKQIALASPPPHIVGLQECWTQEDYLAIRSLTQDILPHGKFYWSGIFGGGLAILSKWPIEESAMFRYPLNGRPQAFWRGDWYVGKGVACARIRMGGQEAAAGEEGGQVVEIFNTHLHAPYEKEPRDSYICHRTAQAWEIAKLMRHAAERGHVVVGLGDFNMVPLSLAHRLIEAHSPAKDVWRVLHPDSAIGAAESEAEKARGRSVPSSRECVQQHGATCDSRLNTWRWSKQARKDLLKRGRELEVDPELPDWSARRLDYVFFADHAERAGMRWRVETAEVGMMMRHPELRCSLSDHFSVETTLVRSEAEGTRATPPSLLPTETYDHILHMISTYTIRERSQRKWRIAHFFAQTALTIGCLIAVWWSPRNFVAFLLMLLSTLGFGAGVVDGLMGLLFVGSELRALREFEHEIRVARAKAEVAEQRTAKT